MPLLLFSLPHEHLVVILVLQVLQLTSLLSGLLDLFDSTHLLILEHAHSVAQLLNISLQLQTNRPGLIVGEALTFNVNDNVWADAIGLALGCGAHLTGTFLALSKGVASL